MDFEYYSAPCRGRAFPGSPPSELEGEPIAAQQLGRSKSEGSMTEQEKKNHWDDLVDDLGVETSAEVAKQTGPVANEDIPGTTPDFDAVPSKSSMATNQSSGWDDLASGLGISVPAPSPRQEKPAAERASVAQPAPVPAEADRGEPNSGPERKTRPAERSVSEDSRVTKEKPSRSGRGRRRGRRRPSEDGEEAQAENFALDLDDIEAAVDFDASEVTEAKSDEVAGVTTGDEATTGDKVETADDQERRPRRRRRRGRRGARRGSEQSADEKSPADEISPADGSRMDQHADDETFDAPDDSDELLDDPDGEDDESSAFRKSRHGSIPTWEEAVGVVVTNNLEARTKAAKSPGGGRGRGKGRGRPPGRGRTGGS